MRRGQRVWKGMCSFGLLSLEAQGLKTNSILRFETKGNVTGLPRLQNPPVIQTCDNDEHMEIGNQAVFEFLFLTRR